GSTGLNRGPQELSASPRCATERATEPSSEPTSQSGLAGLVQKDKVPGPRALSSVVCTPSWTRRTARPYGDKSTSIRNGETPRQLSGDRVKPPSRPSAACVALGRDGARSKGLGESPRIR